MARKAELEGEYVQYHALVGKAKSFIGEGQYCDALKAAGEACERASGMMQYGSRHREETYDSLAAVDIIADVAPPCFHSGILDATETLLKGSRRLNRDTEIDLSEQLSHAKARIADAHRLWSLIQESQPIDEATAAHQLKSTCPL